MKTVKWWSLILLMLSNNRGEVANDPPPPENPLGDPDPVPPPKTNAPPANDPGPKLYDVDVKWPDGMEAYLKEEASIKPFVTKDGEVNVASLLNAYHQTKKMVGMDKVVIPKEDATDDVKNAFYKKLGWMDDKNAYVVERGEESKLNEKFVSDLKDFAHEHKIPLSTAQKMVGFMESQATEGEKASQEELEFQLKEGLDKVKLEYGNSYEVKRAMARKVLSDLVDDTDIAEAMKDPRLGSNPYVLKALIKIGEKVFKEDDFKGGNQYSNALSPKQAQDRIAEIMADKKHPYHRGDKKATAEMLSLYEMRT